jgi:hypothetical protein
MNHNVLFWADATKDPSEKENSLEGIEDSNVLWDVKMRGDFDTSPLIIGNRLVLLWKDSMYHHLHGTIYIFDLLMGNVIQKMELPASSNIIKNIFSVDDKIYGIAGGKLYEIGIPSGNITLVSYIPETFILDNNRSPILLKDKIIIPTDLPICISLVDFNVIWNLNNILPDDFSVLSFTGNDNICSLIILKQGYPHMLIIDSSDGSIIWLSDPLPLLSSTMIKNDIIYCGGKKIYAFTMDGSTLWEFEPEDRLISNMIVKHDMLYFSDVSHTLYCIQNGNLIWKKELMVSPWYYESYLQEAENVLYCFNNFGTPESVLNSTVHAINLENGDELWNITFKNSCYIKASPIISDNIVIIGTVGGRIIALTSDPQLFEQQGDAFLSQELPDKAAESYRKASELYERSGNQEKAQEMEEKITQLELSTESVVPSKTQSLIFPILGILGIVIVSTFLYVFVIQKRSKN